MTELIEGSLISAKRTAASAALAAGVLLSLKHLGDAGAITSGQSVVLLNLGVTTFWFIELRAV